MIVKVIRRGVRGRRIVGVVLRLLGGILRDIVFLVVLMMIGAVMVVIRVIVAGGMLQVHVMGLVMLMRMTDEVERRHGTGREPGENAEHQQP